MFPNDFFGDLIPSPDEFPQEFGLARVFKLLAIRYRPLIRLQRRRVISIVWKDADRGEEGVDEFDAATVVQQIDPDTGHVDDRDIDETRPRAEGHGLPAVPSGPGRIDHLRPRIPIGLLNMCSLLIIPITWDAYGRLRPRVASVMHSLRPRCRLVFKPTTPVM
jgi:hypothetical protein